MNIITLVFLILKSTRCSTVIDVYAQQSSLVNNYCEKTAYCDEGTHVMCMYHNQEKKTGPACHSYVSTTMTSEMVDQILDIVNNIRSKVATGTETGKNGQLLPRAYGMMLMKWDHELATFAQVLADQCFGGREDECRATSKFPRPSQGSGIIQFKFPDWQYLTLNAKNNTLPQDKGLSKAKISFAIDRFFKATYALKKTVTSDMVMRCPPVSELPDTKSRYFFNLIRGTASHIGCGISAYTRFNTVASTKQSVYNAIEIVCNFSDRPQPSEPLYISDPPVPGAGFSSECGCPEGYKESSGCLCEENRTAVWPKFSIDKADTVRQTAAKKFVWRPAASRPKPDPPKIQKPVIRLPVVKNTYQARPKVQSWTKLQQLQGVPAAQSVPETQTQKPEPIHLPKLSSENEVRSDIVKMLQLIKKKAIMQALNNSQAVKPPPEKTRAKIISKGKEVYSNNELQYGTKEMPRFMTILENLAKEVQNYNFDQDKKEYFDNKMKTIYQTVQFNYKEQLKRAALTSPTALDEEDIDITDSDKYLDSLVKITRDGDFGGLDFNIVRQRTEPDTPTTPDVKEQENHEPDKNTVEANATEVTTQPPPNLNNENDQHTESSHNNTVWEDNNDNAVPNNTQHETSQVGHEASQVIDTAPVDSPTEISSSENSPSSYQNGDSLRNEDVASMTFISDNMESDTESGIGFPRTGERPYNTGTLNFFDAARRRARTNKIYRRMLNAFHPVKHAKRVKHAFHNHNRRRFEP